MSSFEPSGAGRSGKVVGVALLGAAGLALVIGIVTLVGGDDADGENGAAPTVTATPTSQQPPSTTQSSTTSASMPVPVPPPATTTAPPMTTLPMPPGQEPSPPPPVAPPPEPGEPKGQNDVKASHPLRVYNNSMIPNLANEAADDFRNRGWTIGEVGNHQGKVPTTTVYFRPGTSEEAAARVLAAEFGIRAEPRFDGIVSARPGVIVIVTNDYPGR
ncbi:LytR cell envelope-related transcriptional attenuator [Herbihabitans rhizosphaerae]|uniref:LytR cell envelope-related transcriptional attenuator n=1 Tax=Herbihabitans rhizosphaerae TaxID=1872711 RepID=A0A4Q7KWX6_9PSEU|nr:LytR C-terminal domain-containing protein [Herbihabitans rhizosphaerae]RZS41106.1 LytR cell envelope-related transcriptional attenuator [Herbihabitans rhizosphaerae]